MKSNLRQPGNTTNISDDYPTHLERGSLGGDDLTDPYGTPVHAQLNDAYVSIVDNSPDGSGGRYSRVTGPDGDSVESLHQSSVLAARGQGVNEHDQIGVSGASAYGSNYGTGGPHIHNHGVRRSGARFNLEPYYWWLGGGGSSPASGGNVTPIESSQEDALNELSNVTKQFITDTARDQTATIVRDVIMPVLNFVAQKVTDDDAEAAQIIAAVTAASEKSTRVIQRESRARLYHNLDTGERIAIGGDKFEKGYERITLGTDDGLGHINSLRDKEAVGDAIEESRGYHEDRYATLLEDKGIPRYEPTSTETTEA